MEEKRLIDSIEMKSLVEEMKSVKQKGLYIPKEEEIFTEEIKKVSHELQKMQFSFDKEYYIDSIRERSALEAIKEAVSLLCLLYEENDVEALKGSIHPFLERVEVNMDESLHLHTSALTYKGGKRPIIESITIAKVETVIQSISLARTIVGAIKNENPKEFRNMWKTDYTIPFFLEDFFAQEIRKEEQNENILKMMRFLRMWTIQVQNLYYKEIESIYTSPKKEEKEKAKMYMMLEVYPNLKGYIDALKLLKIVEEEKESCILREIRKVLEHKKTTEQLLKELEVEKIDSTQVVKERCTFVKKVIKNF